MGFGPVASNLVHPTKGGTGLSIWPSTQAAKRSRCWILGRRAGGCSGSRAAPLRWGKSRVNGESRAGRFGKKYDGER